MRLAGSVKRNTKHLYNPLGRPLSAAYPSGARADLETIPPERQLAVPTRDQGWT